MTADPLRVEEASEPDVTAGPLGLGKGGSPWSYSYYKVIYASIWPKLPRVTLRPLLI